MLDPGGWVDVERLLEGLGLQPDELREVVRPRPGGKDRFELSADGTRIRARYGHSVEVDLGYAPTPPPPVLYHGTARRFLTDIRRDGLSPMRRRQVHLSEDAASAREVGARHGSPVVLAIDAGAMALDGAVFHRLPGGVWLTAQVPAERILEVVDDRSEQGEQA